MVAAANEARAAKADLLLTVGGGSVTDAAKMVGICLGNDVTEAGQLDRFRALVTPDGKTERPSLKPPALRSIGCPQCWLDWLESGAPWRIERNWILRVALRCEHHDLLLTDLRSIVVLGRTMAAKRLLEQGHERAQQLAPYVKAAAKLAGVGRVPVSAMAQTRGESTPPTSMDGEAFRWLVEEFRVSLFAQELGTAEPVSAVKLDRVRAALQGGGGPPVEVMAPAPLPSVRPVTAAASAPTMPTISVTSAAGAAQAV